MKVPVQPEVNIGMVGHVDHGKTTLTKALSGEWTDRHSEEIKRGISIRLGYADTAFYKCLNCDDPICYGTSNKCPKCGEKAELLRAVSFVDSPGHETLMATMLSGAAIMDGALLLIAANEPCPQPQTKEHFMALDITGIKNVVVVQNKIDLVNEEKAVENYEQIEEFIEGTSAKGAPVIPMSAQQGTNIDVLIKAIEEYIPTPERDKSKPARMYIARSFDVNKPGSSIDELKGGVIGGSLIQGEISVGDEIEIKPGRKIEDKGRVSWEPIVTEVTTLVSGKKTVDKVGPGGLVGIGTLLDPAMAKSDALVGRVAGMPDTLPEIWDRLTMEVHLLERVVGSSEELEVEKIKSNEPLMLSAGVAITAGVVSSAREDYAEIKLKLPICTGVGQRIAISRRIGGRWRLIGYGIMK